VELAVRHLHGPAAAQTAVFDFLGDPRFLGGGGSGVPLGRANENSDISASNGPISILKKPLDSIFQELFNGFLKIGIGQLGTELFVFKVQQ
jgi:hypothetical protein